MRTVRRGNSVITVIPVIRGLVTEGERVLGAARESDPQAIAVSISREELSALRNLGDDIDYEMSEIETIFSDLLGRYGEVTLPPPCFSAALQAAEEIGVPLLPIDMNEELYSVTYVTMVGTLDLFKESLSVKRLRRKLSGCESPQEFVLKWDSLINKSKGFSQLSSERERHMAGVLARIARRYERVVAFIELERIDGVCWRLEGSSSATLDQRREEEAGQLLNAPPE